MEATVLVEQLHTGSLFALVGIAAAANLFPGIPEEIPLLMIGVGIGLGVVSFPSALLIVFITLLIIDNVIYRLAYRGSPFIMFVQKKIFGEDLDLKSPFIQKYLLSIVFFSRFVVHVRFLGIILAGVNRMPWRRFIMLEGIALLAYLSILFSLGAYFHGRVARLLEGAEVFKNITILSLGILTLIIVGRILYKKLIRSIKNGTVKNPLEFLGITQSESKPVFSLDKKEK